MLMVPAKLNRLTEEERRQVLDEAIVFAFSLFIEELSTERGDPQTQLAERLSRVEEIKRFYDTH